MMQTTHQAEPAKKDEAPAWPLFIAIIYFCLFGLIFTTIIETTAVFRSHVTLFQWRLLMSAIPAFGFAYIIAGFLTETSMRNSQEKLSFAHRTLYYTTAVIGWFFFVAFPASLVWAVLMFSGLEFKPRHAPMAPTQPAIEAQ